MGFESVVGDLGLIDNQLLEASVSDRTRNCKFSLDLVFNYMAITLINSPRFIEALRVLLHTQFRVSAILPNQGADGIAQTGDAHLSMLDHGGEAGGTILVILSLSVLQETIVELVVN